jgi:hypothetical protein
VCVLCRIEAVEPLYIVQTVLPDIVAFLASLALFVCCRVLPLTKLSGNVPPQRISVLSSASIRGRPLFPEDAAFWDTLGSVATVFVVGVCGIVYPSLLNAVYFIVTLVVMTLWAAHVCDGRSNRPVWQWLRLALLVYTAAYLGLLHITQFHFAHQHLWVAEHLADGGTMKRLVFFLNEECFQKVP